MNNKAIEARQQRFDHLKKQALLVLTTAFRAPLMLMMGCGYVNFNGKRRSVHDHSGVKLVDTGVFSSEPYDADKHGKLTEWLEEGEAIPGMPKSKDGQTAIHRHKKISSSGGASGPHEYQYE